MEKLWTIEELAENLKVNKRYIYRLTSRGEIPYTRVGSRYLRFRPSEIERWLHEQDHEPVERGR